MPEFTESLLADIASGKLEGKLELWGKRICVEGAKALSTALQSANCKLTELGLAGNQVGVEGAKALSTALQNARCELTELDLSNNEIGDEGAKALSIALQSAHCKLTRLNLWENQIDGEGAKALSIALQSANCKLTWLSLSHNQIGDEGAKAFSTALQSVNCKLTTLHLGSNQIGVKGAKALSTALQGTNCKLATLHLGSNKIGDEGAKALSFALQSVNCKLTWLFLWKNQIGVEGAKALSTALQSTNCKLTYLHLSNNEIGDEAKALSIALQSVNCKLTVLDLDRNQIGDEGAKALSIALQSVNCKLTILDLDRNQIGDKGAKALSIALQSVNCKLTILDLLWNQIGDEGAKALSTALQNANCKLTRLDYGGAGDEQTKRIIDDALEQNRALVEIPFLGPMMLHSGIDRSARMKYVDSLKKEKLDTEEIWKREAADMSGHLKSIGIPIGDVLRLVAAFKSLHLGEQSSLPFAPSSPQKAESSSDVSAVKKMRPSTVLPLPEGKKYHVFASHAWGDEQKNHLHVSLLVKELERIGVKVWFDEQRLSGDILGKITDGLKDSFLYLACISHDFIEKIDRAGTTRGIDWCETEFNAATRTHGKLGSLCVVCEERMLNTSAWLGPVQRILGGLLYVDYTDASQVAMAAQQIKREVVERMDGLH